MISITLSPLVEKLSTLLSAHPAAPVLVALDGRCGSGENHAGGTAGPAVSPEHHGAYR